MELAGNFEEDGLFGSEGQLWIGTEKGQSSKQSGPPFSSNRGRLSDRFRSDFLEFRLR